MSSSRNSGDDGSKNSSGGFPEDEPSLGPASYAVQSYVSTGSMLSHLGITLEISLVYDGTTSWFEHEQLVDDWCDITTLDGETRGEDRLSRRGSPE